MMSAQNNDQDWDPYPGDETLPDDISQITFDHRDKNGNNVKFMWGVATSSYQVEGKITTNDWDVFTNIGDINSHVNELALKWLGHVTMSLESPGRAVDHWNLDVFSEDLRRARSLGMRAYRLSLEWSRIQPTSPDDFDLDAASHYREILNLIVQSGMTPIVTINHVTLPKWVLTPPKFTVLLDEDYEKSLKGWQTCDTVNAYVKFVQFIVPKFRDIVKYWITINEPVASVMGAGYLAGVWSPGFNILNEILREENAKKVLFNLIEAHVRAYDAIKALAGDEARVGIAHAMVFPKVSKEGDFKDNLKAAKQWDYCFNQFFLDAIVYGIENKEVLLGNKDVAIREEWRNKLDFVGINYYRSIYIKSIFPITPWFGGYFDEDLKNKPRSQHNELNDMGWEVYPGGLYKFLKNLDKRFGLPIMITENGFAEESDGLSGSGLPLGKRAPYIVAHLAQVLHAIKDGADVLGYFYWSIVDNWEWTYDYLPKARFGLYSVDRTNPSADPLPRNETQGAAALKYIISLGSLCDAMTKFGTVSPSGDALILPS